MLRDISRHLLVLLVLLELRASGGLVSSSSRRTVAVHTITHWPQAPSIMRLRGGDEFVGTRRSFGGMLADGLLGVLKVAERGVKELAECMGCVTPSLEEERRRMDFIKWKSGLRQRFNSATSSWQHMQTVGSNTSSHHKFNVPESLSLDLGIASPEQNDGEAYANYHSYVSSQSRGKVPRAAGVAFEGSGSNSSAAFEVMLECLPSGVPADCVQILLHRKHCRTMRPDIEARIEEEWAKAVTSSARLYDGKLFRFGSCHRWLDTDGSQEVKLEFGVTRYRSFLGTNMAPGWEYLPPEHLANPLSCIAVVHTSDMCIMLIRRSDKVVTAQRCVALPGGYVSPEKANVQESIEVVPLPTEEGHEIKCTNHHSEWLGNDDQVHTVSGERPYSKVVEELFRCPVREACEELGVPHDAFPEPPLLLGITRTRRNLQPSATFYMHTPLTSQQVIAYHDRFHSFESDECIAVPDKDALPTIDMYMPSCSRGALYLFTQLRIRSLHIARDDVPSPPTQEYRLGVGDSSTSPPWRYELQRSASPQPNARRGWSHETVVPGEDDSAK
jgi:hypothetical protein